MDITTTLNKLNDLLKFKSRRLRITVGLIAAIAFVIGLYLSYLQQPTVFNKLDWTYVALIYIAILPCVALINAVRFRVTARAMNVNYSLSQSFAIAVYSTVANMLPLPGGLFVRMANLKNEENTYKNTAVVSINVSALSAIVSLVIASLAYASFSPGLIPWCISAGFLLGALIVLILLQTTVLKGKITALVLVEIGSTLLDAIRIYLCFLIIHAVCGLEQSLILTSASVVGSAISLVPAGLGVKEGAAALIATQIAIIPSSAYIALSLNRIIGLSFFLLLTVPLSMRSNTQTLSE